MKPLSHFFVITGVAGVGKNTLVSMLLNDSKNTLKQVVTYTTRKPRAYEKNGIDYHFITKQDFTQKIDRGFFLEYNYSHHYYGTANEVLENYKSGVHQIIIVDPIGAQSLKKIFKYSHIIVISAGNSLQQTLAITKQRMMNRGTENEESLESRLKHSYAHLLVPVLLESYTIINHDLVESFELFKTFIFNIMNSTKKRR